MAAPRPPAPRLLRHPRLTLLGTCLAVLALGFPGLSVEKHLQPTSLRITGTSSARGEDLDLSQFGDSTPFVVLLRGPAAAVRTQGRRLARTLAASPEASVISPWAPGTRGRLPAPPTSATGSGHAILLVDYHVSQATAMRRTVPALEATLRREISPPVRATQTGYATISRALQQDSLSSSERAELLAAPLLVLVLLLVFRSLIAAAIPLLFGAAAVFAGRGALLALSHLTTVDALSLVVCTMIGLALGVDYSLLIVSRFREELAAGHRPLDAAARARASAGRTVLLAGFTLFAAILTGAFLQAGTLLISLGFTLSTVTLVSVILAWVGLPALLALLGPRINSLCLPFLGRRDGRFTARLSFLLLRRPARVALATAVPLLLLAAPALALAVGAPGVDELPASNQARRDAELIASVAGAGWEAPFYLTALSPRAPITAPPTLRRLARTQRRLEAAPWTAAVIGPAALLHSEQRLQRLSVRLDPAGTDSHRLKRLARGLHGAAAGVRGVRGGLAGAASGSQLLAAGGERAARGAGLLGGGLGRALDGATRATRGAQRLAAAARRIAAAHRRAASAGFAIEEGLAALLPGLAGVGLGHARHLAAWLEGQSGPAAAARAEEARGLERLMLADRGELRRLRRSAAQLRGGLARLEGGERRLAQGNRRLAGAGGQFSSGLARLRGGAARLGGGLEELQGGALALGEGLSGGLRRSYPLQAGLDQAARRTSAAARATVEEERTLKRASPRLFDSGFLLLSALDGARPALRGAAGESINLDGGGRAARLLVIPKAGFNSPGSRAAGARLERVAASLVSSAGLETGISGGAATLNDYGSATKARLPLDVLGIVLVTFLLLLAILRAPLLAALTIGLNVCAVGAAIGVLALICRLPAGVPLGGHHYVDTVGAAAIFGTTFGLSIDYSVFLLARMRESFDRDGDNAIAIVYGLRHTAGVITGAAAIMAAVFVSFAASPVATVSQMGIGLTVAVLLDATVVRVLLLPALIRLAGERVWRVPAWLERWLPRINFHPDPKGAPA